ncbi:TRAP transporter substrate-binding protein [Paracraurococcus ruber]|uniref:ABC transporter substrate-binding protein n=1 Tax=Paracraurococcus ruber TaxID=77675 RepID=A0ABS1CUV1_9PROT|nr:ABC transporter substrate-binding protein [Paracraurococcus ruber]MBK1658081.1 ABC transporter substrate-binding protein [Paracraurococcus ruber]TDG34179.1 ABC transporter substrate-binding protein [Paracraurococcus ruber]
MNRRHILAGSAAGAALVPLAVPGLASAQPRLRWRCPNSFPRSLDTLYGAAEIVARRVREMSDGAFEITVSGPGEVVPALQILDAVGQGSVECGFTSALFYFGKDPSFAFGSALPFGMNSRQTFAWLNYAGGRDQLRPVFAEANIHQIPAGCTGAQMGGWLKKEIRSTEDLQGLKFRIAGLGGSVMQKLGVVPQQIAPSDIYPSLERGVIDGAEYIGPYDDEKLGFGRVARYYYYPGFQEAGPNTDFMVNLRAWEALPKAYQSMLETACAEAFHATAAKYDVANPPALRRLVAGGTQLRGYPREVMQSLYRAAQELYAELGAQNARFKAIHEHWDRFRVEQIQWFRVAEDSLANFQAVATAPR